MAVSNETAATALPASESEQVKDALFLAQPASLAAWLQENLGQQMTAYIAGLKDPKQVGSWASGRSTPRDTALFRMQYAQRAASLLLTAFGPTMTKSWFFGANVLLGEEAPAWVLRHGETPEDWRLVIPAAKQLAFG